jgi:hypothetical protein
VAAFLQHLVTGIQMADARSEDKFPCTCNAVSAVVKIFTNKPGLCSDFCLNGVTSVFRSEAVLCNFITHRM